MADDLRQLIGQTVSRYHITGKLGVGGMGVVYEAQDTRLPRRVALKFLSETLTGDVGAVRRLKREAALIAQLHHPHICTVYETAEHQGRVCIVMERLEGTNLKLHLLRHALKTSEIVDIALQVADALEAVHGLGIVHRDIKPGNIFIDPARVVKVLDFGLARRFQLDDSDTTFGGSSIPGRPLGTPNYMAPERILQQPLDPRSDLFSLGVVMYEMATERPPFGSASTMGTIENILNKEPAPLRAVSPGRPASLERVISQLLAKQADERLQSATALKRALLDIQPDGERESTSTASSVVAPEEQALYGAIWRAWV
jgi:serine/threonine protein kinase